MMKQTRKSDTPEVNAASMIDAIESRIAMLEARDKRLAVQDEIFARGGGGGLSTTGAAAITAEAVRAVLAGEEFVPISAAPISRLAAISQERAVLNAAIKMLRDECLRAHFALSADVYAARRDELRDLVLETAGHIAALKDLDRRRAAFRDKLLVESRGVASAMPGFAAKALIRERVIGIFDDFLRAAMLTGLLSEREAGR